MMVLSVVAAMFGLTVHTYKQCAGYSNLFKSKQTTVTSFVVNDHTALSQNFKAVKNELDRHFGDVEYKVSRQEISFTKARKEKSYLSESTEYFAVITDKDGTIIEGHERINQEVYLWIGSADLII